MAINAATVINIAPELSSQTTDRINYFITEAARYINSSVWGDKADFAHGLYTAHLMTISSSSGVSGTLASEKVGDLSRTYSSSSSSGTGLETTSYGNQFLQLRKTLLISPMVVS